jgi:hypothetical protein
MFFTFAFAFAFAFMILVSFFLYYLPLATSHEANSKKVIKCDNLCRVAKRSLTFPVLVTLPTNQVLNNSNQIHE